MDRSEWDPRSLDNYDEEGKLKESLMLNPMAVPEEKFTREGKSYFYTRTLDDGTVEPITSGNFNLSNLFSIGGVKETEKQSTDWTLKDLAYPLNVPFGGKKQNNLGDWTFINWLVNAAPSQLGAARTGLKAAKGKYFYRPPAKQPINVTPTPPPNVSGTPSRVPISSRTSSQIVRQHTQKAGFAGPEGEPLVRLDFTPTSIFHYDRTNVGGIGDILEATYPKGKGSGLLKKELRAQIADVLIANQGRIGLKPSDPNFIDRQELFNIRDTEGLRYRVKKIDEFMKSVKAENPDSDLLNFQSFKSHISGAKKRKEDTTAPEDVIRNLSNELFPDNPQLAEKLANQYLDTYRSGFARTKEGARRAGISVRQRSKEIETGTLTRAEDKYLPQVDAGHWVAAATGGPTDSHSARLEDASANRAAGDDIAHNINPHAAKMAGIASTFPEAYVNFVDRQLGLNTIPDWKVDFSAKEIRTIESIPQHWSKEQVKEVFIQMLRDRKHDPKFNFGEGTKFTAEDLKPMDEIEPDNIWRRPTWQETAEGLEGPEK